MIYLTVPLELAHKRMDQIVAELCPQYSRSQLQRWIRSGDITLNGKTAKSKQKLDEDDKIIINPQLSEQIHDEPEDIPFDIVYEDDSIMVVHKPVGLVVHPGAGNRTGTLLNGLLHHSAAQNLVPRAGIVHRLDKDTSGLMVVAKTLEAHANLDGQLQARTVKREYLALVQGHVISGATIEGNIGRHPVDRKRMAVVSGGKQAITHYRIETRLTGFTLLRVQLETGRTHQIRVHFSWKLMPIVGDLVYSGRSRIPAELSMEQRELVQQFPRQALHATKLGLLHPTSGEAMQWEVALPEDMQYLLSQLATKVATGDSQ
jgi:23S rRNA pseudouridine1911/1915/1917 synthase